MKIKDKSKLEDNPVYFSNRKTRALEDALEIFMDTFNEYALKNELSKEQISSFKELIIDLYFERKASYFLENKFSNFSEYIDSSISHALNKTVFNDDKENITKVFYYNNKHRLVSNEQY